MSSTIVKIGRKGLLSSMSLSLPSQPSAHFMGNAFIPHVALIPLRQHSGEAARPVINEGANVREGELIAVGSGSLSANVYSSVPGVLHEYRKVTLSDQTEELAAIIKVSGAFTLSGAKAQAKDPSVSSSSRLLTQIEDFGLVRTFSGNFEPLAPLMRSFQEGLERSGEEGILALRMYDYDPSASADAFLLENHSEAVLKGALLVAKIIGVKCLCLLFKDKKTLRRANLQYLESFEELEGFEVVVSASSGIYPCGDERFCKEDAMQACRASSLESIFCINAWTAFAVFNSLELSRPVLQRPVLIAGPALAFPHIVNVRIGTRIRDIIEGTIAECGGFKFEPSRIVVGGLISGKAVDSLDTPVDVNTDAVYFLGKGEKNFYSVERCVHCSRCLKTCPSSLYPVALAAAVQRSSSFSNRLQDELSRCIFCGVCSAVCPASIPLHHIIRGMRSDEKIER